MKDRKQPETVRLFEIMPSLTVNDIGTSLTWYRDVLGFVEAERYEQDGKLLGARLRAGVVNILLSQDDFAKGRDREKGVGFRLYGMTSQDIDKLAMNIRERGGSLVQEPTDQPWGARDFIVRDPDGFTLSISTGVAE